jgi:hypothetical protein
VCTLPENDAGRLTQRGRLPEHAETALLERTAVVLEENQSLQISLRSTR